MKWLLVVLPFLFGCTLPSARPSEDAPKDVADRTVLLSAETLRQAGESQKALEFIRAFISKSPNSSYLQAARLEEGRALEDLEQPNAAEQVYRTVRDSSMGKDPTIAALAEWRLSFTAESSGDDLKALTHVLGVEKQNQFLPEQISRAELPARKAMLLHRMGRSDEAAQSVRVADRGLGVLMSGLRPKPDDSWLARLYVDMGRSLSTHVSQENFSAFIQGQKLSQRYLLKSMDQNDRVWSEKAFQILRSNYSDFWNFLTNTQTPAGMDRAVALRQRRERQIPHLAEFLRLIEEAQALRPLEGTKMNSWQKDFFVMIDELSEKARQVLYSNSETTVLTQESRLLNGLRRNIPAQRPAIPAPIKSEDPNLPQ